jgi:dihydrolipoamide dehydrogenase
LIGLGAEEVTIVEGGPRLLGRLEPFASDLVHESLEAAGVKVCLDTRVGAVSRREVNDAGDGWLHGGEVTVTLDNGETIMADEILVAAGRTPNSDDVGLETVGLKPGGFVDVDDHFAVKGVDGEWLYAIGDLIGRALLTHMGKYQARLCGEVIAARATGKPLDEGSYNAYTDLADHGAVPQVTFTDPEVASVGLTEQDARGQGFDVETVEYDLASLQGPRQTRHRPGGRPADRCDLRGCGHRRTAALRHRRRRRPGEHRRAVARRAELSDGQRDLVAILGDSATATAAVELIDVAGARCTRIC